MEEKAYAPGDFSFVKVESEREMLADAYEAITEEGSWDFMATDPGKAGFVYSRNIKVLKIFMRLKIKTHSVLTLMVVMRNMAKIAIDGWETYVESWKQEELEKSAGNSADSLDSENSVDAGKTPENSVAEDSSSNSSIIAEHTGIAE
jgi:hypothetical protein